MITHRDRVLMTLNHEQPDRVPMDLGGRQTTLMIKSYQNLKKYLGYTNQPIKMMSKTWQTVYVEEDILQRFDIDTRHLRPEPRNAAHPDNQNSPEKGPDYCIDQWGIERKIVNGYANISVHPLQNATMAELENYPWPNSEDLYNLTDLRDKAKKLNEQNEYALVGTCSPMNLFEIAYYLRGVSEFLLDLVGNKEFAHALLRKVCNYRKRCAELYLEQVGEYIDVFQFGDDLGTQTNTWTSPKTYREMIKPYHLELFDHVRKMTKAKFYIHSCGSIQSIMDDLIEVGISIINPVQTRAANMDPMVLKQRFGDRVTFWGGIDTSHVLPNGSVTDVRNEVKDMITSMAPGGGYVLGSVHNIQSDVPPENVVAMFDTGAETVI